MSSAFLSRPMEDGRVGKDESGRFKPSILKQRVAVLPCFRSLASLAVPDDLRRRAEDGDNAAIDDLVELEKLRDHCEKGSALKRPKVLKVDAPVPGYVLADTITARSHWFKINGVNEGSYLCKTEQFRASGEIGPDEFAPCCEHDPEARRVLGDQKTGVLLIAYKTDAEGEVLELPLHHQRRLDADHRLHFEYEILTYTLFNNQVGNWKEAQSQAPAIGSDYLIYKKGTDQMAKILFVATGESLSRDLGPAMLAKLTSEYETNIDRLHKEFGRDLTLAEMHAKWSHTAPAVGAGGPKNYSGFLNKPAGR